MEYVYLPEHSRAIEKDKFLSVVDEIISKNNEDVNLDDIFVDCQILKEDDKVAIKEFLLGRGVIKRKEIYLTSKDAGMNVKDIVANGNLKNPLTDMDFSSIDPKQRIDIVFLQIHFNIGFPKAAKMFQFLKQTNMVKNDGNGNYFLVDNKD